MALFEIPSSAIFTEKGKGEASESRSSPEQSNVSATVVFYQKYNGQNESTTRRG